MATRGPTTGPIASTVILNAEAEKIAAIMARFSRRKLETFLEAGVELLDAIDGDPNLEEIGLEDSFVEHPADGAGCPIADAHDPAWVEWTAMRGAAKRGRNFTAGPEDAEEDDGGGDDITEDVPGFDVRSRAIANSFFGLPGAGCAINGDGELNGDEGDYSVISA